MNISGSFAATGTSLSQGAFCPRAGSSLNLSVWGTFVGSVQLERSFDNGSTWLPVTAAGSSLAFTAPASETFVEPETGVLYRLNCTSYTSGTINYRISQS